MERLQSARGWGLMEFDEAYHIGLFSYEIAKEWDGDEPGRIVISRTPGWGGNAV